jgi:hypothetical protein
MNLKETRREGVDWIHLAQDRVQCIVMTVMNYNESSGPMRGGKILYQLSVY